MYADDVVLFASSEEAASRNLAILEAALEPTGLKINISKTKALHASNTASPRQDTNVGYANRLRRGNKHREQHPDAVESKITYTSRESKLYGDLVMTIECNKSCCPHKNCPFVATHGSEVNLHSIVNHLKSRHRVSNVVVMPSATNWNGQSDPDPNSHLDIAPSIAKRPEGYTSYVHLNNKYVERIQRFRYLGSMISEDGSMTAEISQRIGAANNAFHKLPRDLWISEEMPLYVKWELYKHLVLSRLLYGAEAWSPTESDVVRLEGAYIKQLRVLTGLTAEFDVDGEVVSFPSRSRISEAMDEPRLGDILRSYRLRLYGQVKRAGPFSFLHKWAHLESSLAETAPRGPQRVSWHTMTTGDLYALGIMDTTSCLNRRKWKETTAYYPRGPRKPQLEQEAWD